MFGGSKNWTETILTCGKLGDNFNFMFILPVSAMSSTRIGKDFEINALPTVTPKATFGLIFLTISFLVMSSVSLGAKENAQSISMWSSPFFGYDFTLSIAGALDPKVNSSKDNFSIPNPGA